MVVLVALPSRAANFFGCETQLGSVAYCVGYQAGIDESSRRFGGPVGWTIIVNVTLERAECRFEPIPK